MLGISIDTLRRWDRQGGIRTERDGGNRRLVPAVEIDRLCGERDRSGQSARNRFRCIVTDVSFDGLMAQVELVSISPSRVVAIITRDSAEELHLEAGVAATAIVKSTSMMIAN
jgi:molybdopterin-binding protein